MFRKIVSQLSFSPALVGQLSFYAKRLRKEQFTRRVGLVFVALALVVQSLVVFQAPEPANASNPSDMVPGGFGLGSARDFNNFLNPYDKNQYNLKNIMNYFGITREEILATKNNFQLVTVGNKIGWGHENRPGSRVYDITDVNGKSTGTLYGRELNRMNPSNSQFWAYVGYSKKAGWFALHQLCANLVTDKYPTPPAPKPNPAKMRFVKSAINQSQGNVDATKVKARAGDRIQFKLEAINSGGTEGYIGFYDDLRDILRVSTMASVGTGKYDAAKQTITWPNVMVQPGKTAYHTFAVRIKDNLVSSDRSICTVKNDYNGSTIAIPIDCKMPSMPAPKPTPIPARVSYNKTAVNSSQGNINAASKAARAGDKVTFTLTAKNSGGTAANVSFSDNLTDTLKYSKLVSPGTGTFNSKTKTITWPTISLKPGATASHKFSVQINNSLVTPNPSSCSIRNVYKDAGVTIPVGCVTPPNLSYSKTAYNDSQKTDATRTMAREGNKITYTLTARNSGGSPGNVTFTDNIGNVLRYSKLVNNGGGSYNSSTKTISWPAVSVPAKGSVSKKFTIQLNNEIISPDYSVCSGTNVFKGITVKINVHCVPPAKVVSSKTATNVTRGNVNATTVKAQVNNTIKFTVSLKNTGGATTRVAPSDNIADVLKYAKLTSNGGASYNSSSKTLTWPAVQLKGGQTVTKSFTVKMNSSLERNTTKCPMINKFYDSSITINADCVLPAKIVANKTAVNASQKNIDATKTTARVNDKITFSITLKNEGGSTKAVAFRDNLTSVLQYSKLINKGGGSFDSKTNVLSWPNVNLKGGQTVTKKFTVQMDSVLESTTKNCSMTNTFTGKTIKIPVGCILPAKITASKSAINVSRDKVNATTVKARENDKITFTVSVRNSGEAAKKVILNDDLTSTLKFAKLIDNGGGTFNRANNLLSWPSVTLKGGQTVTKKFSVKMINSLASTTTKCSIKNSFMDKTVTIPVGCFIPPGEIAPSKTATNVSQGNIDATSTTAKAGDRITFTLTAKNIGGQAKDFVFKDDVADTLEYAKIIDNGGGTFNQTARNLTWPTVSIAPGKKEVRTFTVQLLDTIPATPTGLSDNASYNCKIENTFYQGFVVIPVDCPGPKVIEQIVPELPHTGAGANMIFAGIMLAVVTFFYYRSKQLGTEVRLIRRDLNGGTI